MGVSGVGGKSGGGEREREREREREKLGGMVCIKIFFFPGKISKKRYTVPYFFIKMYKCSKLIRYSLENKVWHRFASYQIFISLLPS